jgi:hypothetical protein
VGNGLLQRVDFFGREWSDGADRQIGETNGADGHSAKLLHLVADAGKKAADLAVAAFV